MFRTISTLLLYFFLGYFIVVVIVPDITFIDTMKATLTPIYVDAPLWIFNYFHDFIEAIRTVDDAHFGHLLLLTGSIALALSMPILWCVVVTVLIWLIIFEVFPKIAMFPINLIADTELGNGMPDISEVLMGRTTVKESQQAYIQAREIKRALDKK